MNPKKNPREYRSIYPLADRKKLLIHTHKWRKNGSYRGSWYLNFRFIDELRIFTTDWLFGPTIYHQIQLSQEENHFQKDEKGIYFKYEK
jgi:hypothetical protein